MNPDPGQTRGRHRRSALALAVLVALSAFFSLALPAAANPAGGDRDGVKSGGEGPPKVAADSWILVEERSGEVLASKAAAKVLPMASTTKLMTAYLAVRRLDPNEVVRVGYYPADPVESLMGLEAGQRVSVRDLLLGLVMLSGNDSAVALARAVSGSVPRFVELMNRTARRLGLESTGFRNPIGLDAPGHFSTAEDLATMSRAVMASPRFRRIADRREALLTSYRPALEIETTNDFLLSYPWATGIKTGATQKAGYLLASSGRRRGVELIGVVMGTDSESARDLESARLLDWGFAQYREEVPLSRGEVAAEIPIRFRGASLSAVPAATERVGLRRGQALEVGFELPAEVEGPIRRGARLGRAEVFIDGERVSSVPLLAAVSVRAPTLPERAWGLVSENLLIVGLAAFAILLAGLALGRRRNRKTREALRGIGRKRN